MEERDRDEGDEERETEYGYLRSDHGDGLGLDSIADGIYIHICMYVCIYSVVYN